jgi:hypothetical protein
MMPKIGVPDDLIVEFDFEVQGFYEKQRYSLSLLLNSRLDTDELEFERGKRTAKRRPAPLASNPRGIAVRNSSAR